MSARLDKILGRFKKTVQELDTLSSQADAEIDYHNAEMTRLDANRKEIIVEKQQAVAVASKIRELIGY